MGGVNLVEWVAVLCGVAATALWAWALVNAAGNSRLTPRQRNYWVVLIALTHALGALSYALNHHAFEKPGADDAGHGRLTPRTGV